LLLLHRDVVTNFQNAAKAAVLRMRGGDVSADAVQDLTNSFNSLVDQFVIESERWAESLWEVHKDDTAAIDKEFDEELAALKQLRNDEDGEASIRPTNPHFEIEHNGTLVARADAKDERVIHAYVMVSREHGGATLTASEIRATDTPYGILNRQLSPGDRVSLTFVSDDEVSKVDRRVIKKGPMGTATAKRGPRLTISTTRTPELHAYLGADAHVQAVLDYIEGKCVLQVDSVTIQDNGDTTGTRWLRQEIAPGESVQIEYVT
jgi:hypothetical protein